MVNYKSDLVVAMLLAIQCYLCYFYPWFRQELWGKFRMLYDGLGVVGILAVLLLMRSLFPIVHR
jgi:hypothetical protein